MKRRLTYAGLLVVLISWMLVINASLRLLNEASDLKLYAGATVLLGSIIVFPTLIRKLFGRQIKQDMNALLDDSLGEDPCKNPPMPTLEGQTRLQADPLIAAVKKGDFAEAVRIANTK